MTELARRPALPGSAARPVPIPEVLTRVLAWFPMLAEVIVRDLRRSIFDLRRHRVVPPIEETEQSDHREHLDDLTVVPVETERLEVRRRHLVRHEGGVVRIAAPRARPRRTGSNVRSSRICAIFPSGTPRSRASTASCAWQYRQPAAMLETIPISGFSGLGRVPEFHICVINSLNARRISGRRAIV